MSMFCYQCEQTAKGTGCTAVGVCGKQPDVAVLQDLLVYTLKGIAYWADLARGLEARDEEVDRFMIDALFTTVTNVDFDADAVAAFVAEGVRMRERARTLFNKANGRAFTGFPPPPARNWELPADRAGQIELGEEHGVKDFKVNADVHSVRQIIIYGIKGYAAYADHARILGKETRRSTPSPTRRLPPCWTTASTLRDYVGLAMETGRINYLAMGLLNQAHVERYGHPVPTPVQLGTEGRQGDPGLRPRPAACWRRSSSRPKARGSTSTPTARCSRPTATPA